MTKQPRRHAFLSVWNKESVDGDLSIVDFARVLHERGYDIDSSGGTAASIAREGIPVHNVNEDFPSMLDGMVSTLRPPIHGGMMADPNKPEHMAQLESINGYIYDIVCVDTYPMRESMVQPDATLESVRKKTDIGGPAMLRSAAKGRRYVLCDPADRLRLIDHLDTDCPDDEAFRLELAAKAEAYAGEYAFDSGRFISGGKHDGILGTRVLAFCYGENKHQKDAALFRTSGLVDNPFGLDKLHQIAGSVPSSNNYTDIDRLQATMRRLAAALHAEYGHVQHIAGSVKHGEPCGIGVGDTPEEATRKMVAGNPQALSGGVVMTTFPIDTKVAHLLRNHLNGEGTPPRILDAVIAPSFKEDWERILERKRGKCRILVHHVLGTEDFAVLSSEVRFRQVEGGFIRQEPEMIIPTVDSQWRAWLSKGQVLDLLIAEAVCRTAKSNTIAIASGGMLIGLGCAQPSRVESCDLAVRRATRMDHEIRGAVACSDSFFIKDDGPKLLVEAGVAVIRATSGSVNDKEVFNYMSTTAVPFLTRPDAEDRMFSGH